MEHNVYLLTTVNGLQYQQVPSNINHGIAAPSSPAQSTNPLCNDSPKIGQKVLNL